MVFYWIVGSLTIFYAYGESKLLGSSAFRPGLIYLTTNHMLIMYLNHHVGFQYISWDVGVLSGQVLNMLLTEGLSIFGRSSTNIWVVYQG